MNGPAGAASARAWRRLATAGAVGTYVLVVLGGIVRITGSGMGCGDEWPLCNGRLIPPLDLPTLIEYAHRLAAAAVGLLILAMAVHGAIRGRGNPSWRFRHRIGWLAVGLLLVQVLLGAVTVWLELPPTSVILHLGTAMALLATLLVAAAHGYAPGRAEGRRRDGAARAAWTGAGLGLAVVLAGALVANLGAAPACQGFPLCSGRWLPADDWRVQLHWGHRALAYLLVAWALALPALTRRWRPGDRGAVRWAWAAGGLAALQLGLAAAMMLLFLPGELRAAHVAAGAAVLGALVCHAWTVAHPSPGARVRVDARGARRVPHEEARGADGERVGFG